MMLSNNVHYTRVSQPPSRCCVESMHTVGRFSAITTLLFTQFIHHPCLINIYTKKNKNNLISLVSPEMQTNYRDKSNVQFHFY